MEQLTVLRQANQALLQVLDNYKTQIHNLNLKIDATKASLPESGVLGLKDKENA
jgi:hypothetical protein